ncbi:MAG: PIN domain-containing protein [Dehalococcoidia bacterium]
MYLVDTNVWLERLLDQTRSDEVKRFLDQVLSDHLFITDFTFHSIGVVMSRLKRMDALLRFVQDAFIDGAVALIRLKPEDMQRLVQRAEQYSLDFDDAYQYVAAEKYNLTIVSFDADFDRTELGRRTPAEIMKGDKKRARG